MVQEIKIKNQNKRKKMGKDNGLGNYDDYARQNKVLVWNLQTKIL